MTLHLPPGSWVDLEAFEESVRQGRWEEAIALYEGDLFPADRYADWAAAPRERLSQQFVAVLLALARWQLAAGHPQEALAAARRLLEMDPWQENGVLVGMQACLALGDRAGAIRLYRNLEQTLREEMGIAPSEELQKLYQSLV
ncbi:MAG: bacterial transcriptional activator domain-containing protein [Anaerolineae bacterium]|nr:bacterial transcriptional activator domain-containing protein [Anaerolineae bacterium]